MNGRIVLLNLISLFLVFALVMAASAQTRTVGVDVGNTWRYSTSADWSSTDSTATPPAYVVRYNDTQWLEVTVTGISGTNITAQFTAHYKNGTEENTGGWIDIDTGNNVKMTYMIISGNLTVDDSIYTVSYTNWFINETVQRTYPNGNRDTNHVNITSSSVYQYLASNLYWDKDTGILVELFTQKHVPGTQLHNIVVDGASNHQFRRLGNPRIFNLDTDFAHADRAHISYNNSLQTKTSRQNTLQPNLARARHPEA